ncbi:EamA family transporter [Catalinimonas sp. 4WD22]|uniref:DMT family transporter n=1 Tax=Catalinimonas locisalis TaxID=3133978 RepID=UPI003100CD72
MDKNILYARLAVAFLCLLWGTTYIAIKFGLEDIPPYLFGAIRQLIAGVLLILWGLIRKGFRFPSVSEVAEQIIPGLLLISCGQGFMYWALLYIPSGLAALIASMIPMYAVIFSLFIPSDKQLNLHGWLGFALGAVGMMIVFSENISYFLKPEYLIGILITFLGAFCWAGGSFLVQAKSKNNVSPYYKAGFQLFFGSGGLFVFAYFASDFTNFHGFTLSSFLALAYLVILGSLAGYLAFLFAIKHLPVAQATLYSYVNPLVAVFLGWVIFNEPLGWQLGAGFLVTLSGVYLLSRGFVKRTT